MYITGHSGQVMARSSPIHFGALEQLGRMDFDAIAISKFQNDWLSMAACSIDGGEWFGAFTSYA